MKDLPKVFANRIDKDMRNTQDVYYGSDNRPVKKDSVSIIRKINNIFASPHHVYKSKVKITTSNSVLEKTIVGKTSTDLITIDGELIKIINILDIEKI